MDETKIAEQVAQNIPKEEHIPAPEIKEEPQPSAFESNVELNDPAISLKLADYFMLSRSERFNELTQRDMREVYRWCAEQVQSTELDKVLPMVRLLEAEIGATFKEDKLRRLARFVHLKKQSDVINAQLGALRA